MVLYYRNHILFCRLGVITGLQQVFGDNNSIIDKKTSDLCNNEMIIVVVAADQLKGGFITTRTYEFRERVSIQYYTVSYLYLLYVNMKIISYSIQVLIYYCTQIRSFSMR